MRTIPNLRTMSWRRKIYAFVLLAGFLNIFFFNPIVVHADLFGFEVQDVYAEITENVKETNDLLAKAFEFSQISPYEIINGLAGSTQGGLAIAVRTASKTMALIVATLLLMVDFFRKTINFEWSSKWENILLFLVKIIVIKQVVQNADVIVGYLYAGFQSINNAATGTTIDFLPCGNMSTYYAKVEQNIIEQVKKGWWDFWFDRGAGNVYYEYYYEISPEAVKMFYPNATFPADLDLNTNPFVAPTERMNFMPTLEWILWQPYFLALKAIAYFVFVIVIGRVFELCIYTIFAPLPLATFASDVSSDLAKNFIKNYIATVIQIAVIVIMFIVYVAVNRYFVMINNGSTALSIVALFSLGLGVFKSGEWSRKVCGM